MNILLIPGVCFSRERRTKIIKFVDGLEKNLKSDVDVLWFGRDQFKENQGLNAEGHLRVQNTENRRFLSQLSFDTHYVIENFRDIPVPQADIYIGHSAGSLLAMLSGKPCITMGNPASLIDMFWGSENFDFLNAVSEANNPILNVVNRKDVAAYPFQLPSNHVENFMFTTNHVLGSKNLEKIHESYFENKKVFNLIKKKLK